MPRSGKQPLRYRPLRHARNLTTCAGMRCSKFSMRWMEPESVTGWLAAGVSTRLSGTRRGLTATWTWLWMPTTTTPAWLLSPVSATPLRRTGFQCELRSPQAVIVGSTSTQSDSMCKATGSRATPRGRTSCIRPQRSPLDDSVAEACPVYQRTNKNSSTPVTSYDPKTSTTYDSWPPFVPRHGAELRASPGQCGALDFAAAGRQPEPQMACAAAIRNW